MEEWIDETRRAPEEAGSGRGRASARRWPPALCGRRITSTMPARCSSETRIVSDVHIGEDYEGAEAWTLRDRPARDGEDFGDVFKSGELVGKVERVEGSLVVYRELVS